MISPVSASSTKSLSWLEKVPKDPLVLILRFAPLDVRNLSLTSRTMRDLTRSAVRAATAAIRAEGRKGLKELVVSLKKIELSSETLESLQTLQESISQLIERETLENEMASENRAAFLFFRFFCSLPNEEVTSIENALAQQEGDFLIVEEAVSFLNHLSTWKQRNPGEAQEEHQERVTDGIFSLTRELLKSKTSWDFGLAVQMLQNLERRRGEFADRGLSLEGGIQKSNELLETFLRFYVLPRISPSFERFDFYFGVGVHFFKTLPKGFDSFKMTTDELAEILEPSDQIVWFQRMAILLLEDKRFKRETHFRAISYLIEKIPDEAVKHSLLQRLEERRDSGCAIL